MTCQEEMLLLNDDDEASPFDAVAKSAAWTPITKRGGERTSCQEEEIRSLEEEDDDDDEASFDAMVDSLFNDDTNDEDDELQIMSMVDSLFDQDDGNDSDSPSLSSDDNKKLLSSSMPPRIPLKNYAGALTTINENPQFQTQSNQSGSPILAPGSHRLCASLTVPAGTHQQQYYHHLDASDKSDNSNSNSSSRLLDDESGGCGVRPLFSRLISLPVSGSSRLDDDSGSCISLDRSFGRSISLPPLDSYPAPTNLNIRSQAHQPHNKLQEEEHEQSSLLVDFPSNQEKEVSTSTNIEDVYSIHNHQTNTKSPNNSSQGCDSKGRCIHHPNIQLRKKKSSSLLNKPFQKLSSPSRKNRTRLRNKHNGNDSKWVVCLKACPYCEIDKLRGLYMNMNLELNTTAADVADAPTSDDQCSNKGEHDEEKEGIITNNDDQDTASITLEFPFDMSARSEPCHDSAEGHSKKKSGDHHNTTNNTGIHFNIERKKTEDELTEDTAVSATRTATRTRKPRPKQKRSKSVPKIMFKTIRRTNNNGNNRSRSRSSSKGKVVGSIRPEDDGSGSASNEGSAGKSRSSGGTRSRSSSLSLSLSRRRMP